jgi:HD-GYP domain-containing protein (c-di-GMP phosphodiesterase class II)
MMYSYILTRRSPMERQFLFEVKAAILNDAWVMELVNKLADHHRYSADHCLNVADLGVTLSLAASRLNIELNEQLWVAGALHDIGKLDVPAELLDDSRKLTEGEWQMIEGHVRAGYEKVDNPRYEAARNILIRHHEFGQRRYPRNGGERRQGERATERRNPEPVLIEAAKMLAVADSYHASRTRAGRDHQATMEYLRQDFNGECSGYLDTMAAIGC